MRRLAPLVLVVALALPASAGAATIDPAKLTWQQAIKRQFQLRLNRMAPGMKVTTVSCNVAKNTLSARCRANFTFKTIRGYYTILGRQKNAKAPVSWATSGSPVCFVAKTGDRVDC